MGNWAVRGNILTYLSVDFPGREFPAGSRGVPEGYRKNKSSVSPQASFIFNLLGNIPRRVCEGFRGIQREIPRPRNHFPVDFPVISRGFVLQHFPASIRTQREALDRSGSKHALYSQQCRLSIRPIISPQPTINRGGSRG